METEGTARESAAAACTVLRLEGRDALGLLHRLSSASLADLAPGRARATLFCDFRGRMLHRAVAAVTGDGAVWLLRDDAPAPELAAYLDRHVFREDVRLADLSAGWSVGRVPARGVHPAPGTSHERDGIPLAAAAEPGFVLEVRGGAASGVAPAPALAEARRIRAGLPRHGHEIAGEFNPFEVGLAREVHLAKGCYTGQEALLRLVTYGSVRRRLALLEGGGAPPAVPADVTCGGASAGRVTSAAPWVTDWVALAVLTHQACEPGAALAVAGAGAVAAVRPFPLERPPGLP
ncbi:MAG: hypothetical protein HZC42_07385 [Candidatus Eisenbacteria bacterium]|nr:hypothetical protein [Candidatus Eisenbacteria bacterium]